MDRGRRGIGEHEPVHDQNGKAAGRLVRQRWPVAATVQARLEPIAGLYRLTVSIDNRRRSMGRPDKDDAVRQFADRHSPDH